MHRAFDHPDSHDYEHTAYAADQSHYDDDSHYAHEYTYDHEIEPISEEPAHYWTGHETPELYEYGSDEDEDHYLTVEPEYPQHEVAETYEEESHEVPEHQEEYHHEIGRLIAFHPPLDAETETTYHLNVDQDLFGEDAHQISS